MDMLFDDFTPYMFRQIRHHRDTLDVDNPRDFLDYLIMEGDQNPAFGYWSITMTIIAVYLGASDTLTNQLRWLTIYLAEHPELQDRNKSFYFKAIDWHCHSPCLNPQAFKGSEAILSDSSV